MFGRKKVLKKVPPDLVPYIRIETEAIGDANDKMMLASYCLHKLEVVNWQLQLLERGSEKYVVTQSKAYLEMVRDQLTGCYEEIMKVKIVNPKERPLLDIKYPKGYEG